MHSDVQHEVRLKKPNKKQKNRQMNMKKQFILLFDNIEIVVENNYGISCN